MITPVYDYESLPDWPESPEDQEALTHLIEEDEIPLAALYGRVSTDDQDVRTQAEWGTREAREHGYRVLPETTFMDEDQSGMLSLPEREQGRRLWGLLHGPGVVIPGQSGSPLPVRAVFVWTFDRWGRNPDDAIANLRTCHEAGIRVYFQDVPIFDPDDPSSMLLIRLRSIFAEFEVLMTRKRIRTKFNSKRSRGELCGTVAYGFRRVERNGTAYEEPDPAAQRWLQLMLEQRARGHGYERIATMLTRAGAPLPDRYRRQVEGGPVELIPGRRGKWNPGSVRNILATAGRRAKRDTPSAAEGTA